MANPHGDNVNKTAQTDKVEAPGKAAAESAVNTWSKDAAGAKSSDTTPQDSVAKKSEEHGFLNIDFQGMGNAFNQYLHGAGDMIANIGKPSPEQLVEQQRAQQEKAAEEARKHAPESSTDAAKHGGLVWTTNAEGKQVPQPPGETNPLFGGKVDGPMEAMAWARYNQASSNQGFFHASKDDTLDGKRVE